MRITIGDNTESCVLEGRSKIDNMIYYRFGKQYKKLKRNEIIKEGAMQSWCHGELQPITNSDGKTIGGTPSNFSDERDFYNPIN